MKLRPVVFPMALAIVALIWPAYAVVAAGSTLTKPQVSAVQGKALRAAQRTDRSLKAGTFNYYGIDGTWSPCSANTWVSGYLPGSLWAGYELTGDAWYRTHAKSRQKPLGRLQITSGSLDIGQRYFYSFARAYDLTGEKSYRNTALQAAKIQALRYYSRAGVVRSRNTTGTCDVIVDELMNIQLLFWASRNGGSASYRDMARTHARTVARDFVRDDGSTYHVISYDTSSGTVVATATAQGYSAESMWSRGQAWAIYGFANAYKETKDPLFLSTARRVADRYWSELPSDTVPFWDFRDPAIPDAPRDSSAAAIAASGLEMLSLVETDSVRASEDASRAKTTIAALATPAYQSSYPMIALSNGTLNYWSARTRNCALSFGDYFFLESLLRLRLLPAETPPLAVKRVRASRGVPSRAVDRRSSTYWSAKGKQWIQLDFGTRQPVSAVAIAVVSGSNRSAGFKILTSTDAKHWRTAARPRSSATVATLERFEFTTTRARFVRVQTEGTTRSSTLGISEIRAY